jgi:hypothetical protein
VSSRTRPSLFHPRALWVLALLLAAGCAFLPARRGQLRWLIGATAPIEVEEAGLVYLARIDTGATSTSLRALDVEIDDASPDMNQNVGKRIRFRTLTAEGEEKTLESVITAVQMVSNSQGTERRYKVPLTLRWQYVNKTVDVNLRDRSEMTYKLLIGRDWLGNSFVVDVSLDAEPAQAEAASIGRS